jgi:hypothetical protein
MGGGNSPSIAGRHGAAFLRLLRRNSKLFQGTLTANTWWRHFGEGTPFNPKLGQGAVLIGDDRLPAVLIWSHCDDFFIHGPNYAKTAAAFTVFLDIAVAVGLLCHPGKLTPPCQKVKYTGLVFDIVGVPTLRIPEYKVDRALALIDYVLKRRAKVSRLSTAVVTGVLKSLTEATPARIGHTYLRS